MIEKISPANRFGPAPFIAMVLSLICQIAGFSAGVVLPSPDALPALPVLGHCLTAGALARLLRLSLPWIALNMILPIGAAVVLLGILPSWVLALLATLALLTYLPTFWTRVPFYPSRQSALDALAQILPHDRAFTFVDLGSGFGKVLFELAPRFPLGEFTGIELSPMPFAISWLRSLRCKNVRFKMQSFWDISLSPYDFTYAFLSPTPMKRLWGKVKQDLCDGQVFITNSFLVEDEPDRIIELDDQRQDALHVFFMGSSSKPE